ncbi:MAG: cell division protein FtsQ/DivIB [Spongiibacteraceae bacterium]
MALFKASKKINQTRGASRQQPKPSRSVNWGGLIPVCLVLLLIMVCTGIYQVTSQVLSQPVSRVVVKGDFKRVGKQVVERDVEAFLDAGFVMLNLAAVREKLIQQPWIFDVSIERNWPDEIIITVVEQTPIAQWGMNSYLNNRGELFKPETGFAEIDGLPQLYGPKRNAVQVMTHFREFSAMLAPRGMALKQLGLDGRGNWSLLLSNEVEVVLGHTEVAEKLTRLISVYDLGLAADFASIKTIDMRYGNGFSVAWRQQKS